MDQRVDHGSFILARLHHTYGSYIKDGVSLGSRSAVRHDGVSPIKLESSQSKIVVTSSH